jgi:hypothetical protein
MRKKKAYTGVAQEKVMDSVRNVNGRDRDRQKKEQRLSGKFTVVGWYSCWLIQLLVQLQERFEKESQR